MTNQLSKQELDEIAQEIKIEQERKEHYKKQLEMLRSKVKAGDIQDPANFKIESIPVDLRELMDIESNLK